MSIELQSFLQGHNFTRFCSTRPPAIGEENDVTSVDGRMSTHSSVSGKSEVSSATPRRTDIDLGFEPEGSASPMPACERWKHSLHNVLEDSEGIRLFKKFLADTKQNELLDCWLACKGFRDFGTKHNHSNNSSAASSTTGPITSQRIQMDSAALLQRLKLAKRIFNTYFKKDKCMVSSMIKNATRQYICKQIKTALSDLPSGGSGELDSGLFDTAQNEIEMNIEENSYQAFLTSDLFRQYAAAQCEPKHMKQAAPPVSSHHMLPPDNKGTGQAASSNVQQQPVAAAAPPASSRPPYSYLPRLDENQVWHPHQHRPKSSSSSSEKDPSPNSAMGSGLSQLSLAKTAMKNRMAASNQQYPFPGDKPDQSNPAYPYFAAPSAMKYYVPPASANASDQASSDATSDTVSITDSSLDGSVAYSLKTSQKRMMRSQYKRNVTAYYSGEENFVPLSRRWCSKQQMANLATEHPAKFFAQLKERLEKVIEERRTAAVKEAALDDVDEILNSHLERVMKTPNAVDSPRRNHSPPPDTTSNAVAPQQRHRHSPTRGMVHGAIPDPASGDMPPDIRKYHHSQKEIMDSNRMTNYDQNMILRKTDSLRRRKEVAVGMAPNEVPDVPTPIQPVDKNFMIHEWIMQSSNNSKSIQPQGSLPRRRSGSTRTNQSSRQPMYVNRGTSFPIQAVVTSRASQFQSQPLQPISQDPEMPPLDQPDTSTTIEEVKRRLIEETESYYVNPMQCLSLDNKAPSAPTGSHVPFSNPNAMGTNFNAPVGGFSKSGPSTGALGRASVPSVLSSGSDVTLHSDSRDYGSENSAKSKPPETTCVYYLPGEQIAYKIHVPHNPVTLGQFKTYLSRKGHFRYFFKQYSPEIGAPVLFEIQKDSDVLPLWENTVVAKFEHANP